MDKLRAKLKPIWERYKRDVYVVEEKYKKYREGETKVYSTDYSEKKYAEQKAELQVLVEKYHPLIDRALEDRLRELEPKRNIIDSIEYQTKLSNTLNLLTMTEGEVDNSYLDFIVQANDTTVLEMLDKKYRETSTNAGEWIRQNNYLKQIERMRKFTNDVKSKVRNDFTSQLFDNNTWNVGILEYVTI